MQGTFGQSVILPGASWLYRPCCMGHDAYGAQNNVILAPSDGTELP